MESKSPTYLSKLMKLYAMTKNRDDKESISRLALIMLQPS